jgi:hypothetical protein
MRTFSFQNLETTSMAEHKDDLGHSRLILCFQCDILFYMTNNIFSFTWMILLPEAPASTRAEASDSNEVLP